MTEPKTLRPRSKDLVLDGERLRLNLSPQAGSLELSIQPPQGEAAELSARLGRIDSGWVTLHGPEGTQRARVVRAEGKILVSIAGESYVFESPSQARGGGGGGGSDRVEAPMPGTVLEVLVANGDQVEEGQDLLVVEAMKMEHRLKAPYAGTVRGLEVSAQDRVEAGVVLLEIDPAES